MKWNTKYRNFIAWSLQIHIPEVNTSIGLSRSKAKVENSKNKKSLGKI